MKDNTANIVMLPIHTLHPHPDNPRKDVGDVSELAESIKANGVLQNLTVVPYVSPVHKRVMNGLYTVIIGHRRLAAAKLAGLTEMPCVIVEMTEREQLSTMLTENMQRVDLTVYEQAQGFQLMLDLGVSMEEIAEKSGFSKATVKKRLEIARLDSTTLKKVSERQLSLGDFDELAKVDDIEVRNQVLASIGTPNFKSDLQKALRAQQVAKRMEEWLTVIRTFATEIQDDFSGRKFVTNYGYWQLTKEVVVPADSETAKYYYKIGREQIDLYTERDTAKDDAEKAAVEERRRKADCILHLYEDINTWNYDLRCDFVKGLSNAVFKRHTADVYGFVVNTVYRFGSRWDNQVDLEQLAYLLGVKLDKADMEEEGRLTDCPGIRSAIEAFPEKTMFCMAYSMADSEGNGYWKRCWGDGKWGYQHNGNSKLDELYAVLAALGYEMSDDEKEMQSGDHDIFRPGYAESMMEE